MDLKGKVVIVTGASRGIGRGAAVEFAREGCKLVLAARTKEDLEETKALVEAEGAKAVSVVTDVTKATDIKKMYDAAEKSFGTIDVVINNAGVVVRKTLPETTEEDYDLMFDVNVRSVFLSLKEAASRMKKGVVINISSSAGLKAMSRICMYSASKFAVNGMTEGFAADFQGTVYAACPGPVNTDMQRDKPEGYRKSIDQPRDIGRRLVKLCKEEKYESGSAIPVWEPL